MTYLRDSFHHVARHSNLRWDEVEEEIRAGNYHARIIAHEGERCGFVIYSTQRPVLRVHALYTSQRASLAPACKWLADEARANDCPTVQFQTKRKGWARRLKRLGWGVEQCQLLEVRV